MGRRRATKKHFCTLDLGSDSMLSKTGKGGHCHNFKKTLLIAVLHPSSWKIFNSYPAIVAERQRQLIEGGPWIIHPYSLVSLFWKSCFMLLVNMAHFIVASLRFALILPTKPASHSNLDHILLMLQMACLFDVYINFNMGYKERHEANIVVIRHRIVLRYLFRWFLVDILSALPIGYFMPYVNLSLKYQMFVHLIPCIRCLRICSFLKNFKIFVKIFNTSYIWRRGLRHFLLFAISVHWCSCLLYVVPLCYFYWTEKIPEGYCSFLVKENRDLTKLTAAFRYEKAMFISCAAFFGTGYSMFMSTNADEIVINACVILYGSVFMVYTLVLLLKIYMTKFSSKMRYQELMNQMEKYMRHRQFSSQMKNRVRDFYNYAYQERYFKEEAGLQCLSEQLRNEITLDTCHKLIEKVSLFVNLPASAVGTVLGCLKPEVYMPNDLIIRAGDIGECMYFIANGTVAVYSMKGAEVCHLDDGSHFGEVALLMKDRKRVATVVAVEITQVYRLDGSNFRDFIMTYKELYERVEMLASKRMHETVLIDEVYKQHHAFVSSTSMIDEHTES